jgi:hypothetical protein
MKRILTALFFISTVLASDASSQWTRADILPEGRIWHSMAYDSTRDVVVMFGAMNGGRETWEWNGVGWVLASMDGPPPRENTAMAYDSVRKMMVVFGGWTQRDDAIQIVNDTWTWNGIKWEEKKVAGPPARWGAAMAFDKARGVARLFGGVNYANATPYSTDFWEWNGTAWRKVAVAGAKPSGRRYHAMAYDESRGRTVLFGGEAGDGNFSDAWEFDGAKWAKVTATGPVAPYEPVMVYDSARRKCVLVFYTYTPEWKRVYQVWTWDGAAWKKISSFPPPKGFPGTWEAAYDAKRNRIVIFGSAPSTWLLDGLNRIQVKPDWQFPPKPDAMTYDAKIGKVLMFRNGTWAWDGWGWYELSKNPLGYRGGVAMAFDGERGVPVLFGGASYGTGPTFFNDTWTWDKATLAWTQASTTGPSHRYGAAMAYDAARSEIIMFGGVPGTVGGEDPGTWAWNGSAWTLKASSGPAVRHGHGMAYDGDNEVVYLYGGLSPVDWQTEYNDLWEWDGAAWTLVPATGGPGPRVAFGLAYDSIRSKLVLAGGKRLDAATERFVALDDVWEYAGGVWTEVAAAGPSPRSGQAMVFNESKGKITMAGGQGDLLATETWLYGPQRPIVTGSADFDGDGKSDFAVYRYPSGEWFFQGGASFAFGTSGDVPAAGDYNGDGRAEAAIFRPLEGKWMVRGGATVKDYGGVQDVPVPGDYNGDGRTEVAFFRPKTGEWFLRGQGVIVFGSPGDVPVPADYDGNEKTDVAVYRPSNGQWLVRNGTTSTLGGFDDIPIPADYNGDGRAEPAVFSPGTGRWRVLNGPQFVFGRLGDIPVPGHYDGPGKVRIAVYRPSTGEWLMRGRAAVVLGGPGRLPICRGN